MSKNSKELLMNLLSLRLLLFTGEKSFKDKTKSNISEIQDILAENQNTKKMLRMKRNILKMRRANLKVMMLLKKLI